MEDVRTDAANDDRWKSRVAIKGVKQQKLDSKTTALRKHIRVRRRSIFIHREGLLPIESTSLSALSASQANFTNVPVQTPVERWYKAYIAFLVVNYTFR